MDARPNYYHITRLRPGLAFGLVLAAIAIATLLAYLPGLSGPYVLDDQENIAGNAALAIDELSATNLRRALLSNDSGPLRRPLATLSFSLNRVLAGGFENVLYFKATNLIIHVVNGFLLFVLTLSVLRLSEVGRSLASREQLHAAALTAVLWVLHPIQLTNVLYVVQRMNSLAALFVIAGLIIYVHGRHRFEASPPKGLWLMVVGVALGTFLGGASKENAALLPLLALAIEFCFFRRDPLTTRQRRLLGTFYFVIVALPATFALAYFFMNPSVLAEAFKIRSFSMTERLLTESRVLWHYISLITMPSTHRLGLFHDDIPISTGLLTPPTTLLALVALFGVVAFATIKRAQYPFVSFAALWFLAGHLLESSAFGLEIAYEHRNYLPAYGILLAIASSYIWISRQWDSRLRLAVAVSTALALGFTTWTRADAWRSLATIAETEARNHPLSPRANELAAQVNAFEKSDLPAAINYAAQAVNVSPHEAGFRINLYLYLTLLSAQMGQQIAPADGKHIPDGSFQIAGFDSGLTASVIRGRIQLTHALTMTATIDQLLATRPVTVHTLGSLNLLRRCITEKPEICQRVAEQGLKWHIIAASNPSTSKTYHALLQNNTAELYASASDYSMALDYADRASQVSPEVIFYKVRRAEYLVGLGRLNEARTLLTGILASDPESDALFFNRALLESVTSTYNEAIAREGRPSLRPEPLSAPRN